MTDWAARPLESTYAAIFIGVPSYALSRPIRRADPPCTGYAQVRGGQVNEREAHWSTVIEALRTPKGKAVASITESIDVDVPVSTAYNQWTQFQSFPEFMGGVDEISQLDETHLHWKTSIGGVSREFDTEITEQHPDERVAWKSTDGTTHAGVITFHRLSESTSRVTAQIDWAPEGMVEKAGSALGFDTRQVKGDLTRFKEFIEARGSESGAWRGEVEAG